MLVNADGSDGATNRAYYAMYEAAMAALSWAGADTQGYQKHAAD
jgi:uncharacterized protein (UPF0332 family)